MLPLAALTFVLSPMLAAAQDFRVETEVFVGKNKEPMAEYLTIFKAGVVYDFMLSAPEEITIYDVQRGRFILLDPQRNEKAEVSLDELRQLTADIKIAADNAGDENVRFLANPVFQVNVNPQQREVTLSSKPLTYSAKGKTPEEPGLARRYADFADGYARLNGLRLGNLPPFARMKLNEQLVEQGWLPEEVTRTIPAQAVLAKDQVVRSRHLYTLKVLPTDEKRIDSAIRYKEAFREVNIRSYLKWLKPVAKAD
jgi:hypothetical protein